ncbi:ANTAR domain-containing protein [Friedmanniella luteola]|uniref:ANTAR domain-containing protein n=1 Tax=Friedmanniella luteola TaxID=546871 RepID=A0A1H1SPZ1_9ACTN|nr:GAF and ANTAR domain-containing protein [Friedmanniella luteola]SDS50050.1 ANTAR domain-containing protein [Friedmanniella luteola]
MTLDPTTPGPPGDDGDLAVALAALADVELGRTPVGAGVRVLAATVRELVRREAEVSVTIVQDGRPRTAAFTDDLAVDLDERQYSSGAGPCLEAARTGRTIPLVLEQSEERYPEFVRAALRRGLTHTLSVPVPVQGDWTAALNLYGTTGDPFSAGTRLGVERFAPYAGTFLANLQRHHDALEQAAGLQEAMRSRATIEQAKGVLMAQQRCSADAAFALLVRASQRDNVKLRDLAAALVERAARP